MRFKVASLIASISEVKDFFARNRESKVFSPSMHVLLIAVNCQTVRILLGK